MYKLVIELHENAIYSSFDSSFGIIDRLHFTAMAPEELLLSSSPPQAPKVIGPKTQKPTRPTVDIPQSLIDRCRVVDKQEFNAEKHLSFQPPSRIHSMKEIGLEGQGVSPNAVSEPFPLFTEEAVRQMRAEAFSKPVLDDCRYASTFNNNQIRAMGPG